MILDAIPAFSPEDRSSPDFKKRALAAFVDLVERKLGARFMHDARTLPYEDASLAECWLIAEQLREIGATTSLPTRASQLPDEPLLRRWSLTLTESTNHQVGGASIHTEKDALMAAIGEALERYVWYTQNDYYRNPIKSTEAGMKRAHVSPKRFAGFSDAQRAGDKRRELYDDTEYLWIEGYSLTQSQHVYLPAQTVTGYGRLDSPSEPLIRQRTTIGLATWPTQTGARLAGALEVIERDAYMIMWLNQLTLPRIKLEDVASRSHTLAQYIAKCERYGLRIHAMKMLTDAPTHAVCVVVEDTRSSPRFSVGLRAHQSLTKAIEKALTEALRARLGVRHFEQGGNVWDESTPVEKIGHRERVYYWAVPKFAKHLEFMIAGAELETPVAPWEHDTDEAHLARIISWCREIGYECISVPLTHSKVNRTALHIEVVTIPEMQPIYLGEPFRMFGGTRLTSVPKKFGYPVRKEPFTAGPHPFS